MAILVRVGGNSGITVTYYALGVMYQKKVKKGYVWNATTEKLSNSSGTFGGWTDVVSNTTGKSFVINNDITLYALYTQTGSMSNSNLGGQLSNTVSVPSGRSYVSATLRGNTYDDPSFNMTLSVTGLTSKSGTVPRGTNSASISTEGWVSSKSVVITQNSTNSHYGACVCSYTVYKVG